MDWAIATDNRAALSSNTTGLTNWRKIVQILGGIPRRNRTDRYTPAEHAIRAAILAVEEMGAHTLLTEAVVLLAEAQEKVADFVELPDQAPAPQTVAPIAK
jgi:hypothetical protein